MLWLAAPGAPPTEFLKTQVTSRERDRNSIIEKSYEIRTHKLESKLQLFDYLSKFPLFGYKFYGQIYLNNVHTLFLNNEHKTLEGKNKLILYTNLMKVEVNKDKSNLPSLEPVVQRGWDHLNNFYKY